MLKFAVSVFPLGAVMDLWLNGARVVMHVQSTLLSLADCAATMLLPL